MEKGYKGFNKNLQCTPDGKVFQYEVGKTYEEPEAVPCKRGFHFCKNPFFVWDFYGIFESRFCVVEADASNVIDHENKSVTKKITIKAELSLGAFVKECVAYMIDLCDPKKVDVSDAGSSGDAAKIGSSGDAAKIGSSGYAAKIDCSGNDSVVAAIGKYSSVKAAKGCWIVLAEYDSDGKPVTVKSAKIDGKKLKAETYYTLKKGKIVQVED